MPDAQPSPDTPVTLVIVYHAKENVELAITRKTAVDIIQHREQALATVATYAGTDLNGNPYLVDVGMAAAAVYVK